MTASEAHEPDADPDCSKCLLDGYGKRIKNEELSITMGFDRTLPLVPLGSNSGSDFVISV